MKCTHATAAYLESVTRAAFGAMPGGFGGLIDNFVFESDPFLPALISLLPYKETEFLPQIEAFLNKYYPLVNNTSLPKDTLIEQGIASAYSIELSYLVRDLANAKVIAK